MNETSNYVKIISFFDEICQDNNLWYSLGNSSLLTAVCKFNLDSRKNYLEVFINKNTFLTLKQKFSNYLLNYNVKNNYFVGPNPIFYMKNCPIFIKLILLVETTPQKLKKFLNIKNRTKFQKGLFLSFKKHYSFGTFFLYPFLKLCWFIKPLTYLNCYELLFTNKHKGFYAINNLSQDAQKNWIHNISYKNKKIDFLGVKVDILQEYQVILQNRYGKKYNVLPNKIKELNTINLV